MEVRVGSLKSAFGAMLLAQSSLISFDSLACSEQDDPDCQSEGFYNPDAVPRDEDVNWDGEIRSCNPCNPCAAFSSASAPPCNPCNPCNPCSAHKLATRVFSGPNVFRPDAFGAYGIIAFSAGMTSASKERYLMICEAYVAAMPHVWQYSEVSLSEQIATVWPIDSDSVATDLNSATSREELCDPAVKNYGLRIGQDAIKHAEKAIGKLLTGVGPYLLAWAPPSEIGDHAAVVLKVDMSGVTTDVQAANIFEAWKNDIEAEPELWTDGSWDLERVRLVIQQWADKFGTQIMSLFG